MVAITPQTTDQNQKLIAQRKLDFEVLYDEDNSYAQKLGLKHGFADDLKEVYGTFGINLDEFNGNSKWELPVPARFVVDSAGVIRSADFNSDYTVRAEPAESVAAVKALA